MTRDGTTTPEESGREGELFRDLRALPRSASLRTPAGARAAFVHAFEPIRWYEPVLSRLSRASLPVVLASVVVIYLSWGLCTASALMQGPSPDGAGDALAPTARRRCSESGDRASHVHRAGRRCAGTLVAERETHTRARTAQD